MASPADTRLTTEVEHALGLDPQVDVRSIRVQAVDGRVVLTGFVATLAQREAAERTARRALEKMGAAVLVENDLAVAGGHERSNLHLERALDQALAAVPGLPADAVGARVEDGVAHLVGHVTSAGQVEAALAAARQVRGLKGVVSEIQITTGSPPDPADLISRVSETLGWDARVNHRQIAVSADAEGTVTLQGEVVTIGERNAAEEAARSVAGVHKVINRIRALKA